MKLHKATNRAHPGDAASHRASPHRTGRSRTRLKLDERVMHRSKSDLSIDHLVGASEEVRWNGKPESFCRFLVDNQFVPSRALNCQIG